MSIERLREQLRDVGSQNQALQADLQGLRQQLEKLRATPAATASAPPMTPQEVQALREERQLLNARLNELSSSSSVAVKQRDQQDQVHVHELKRLRQDIEGLHNQKEVLRRQLQDADRERQDLQENFLYVKNQLDKVQLRQAQVSSNPAGESSKELQRCSQTLVTVQEERSRLSMRLEGLLREVEKEKAYHEQSLERLMNANARLMEEKDKAANEVQRISQLYSESVQNLQQTQSGVFRGTSLECTGRAESMAGDPADLVDMEELGNLRAQVMQVDEALKRKEHENDSLKNRIRKLAVA